MKASRLLSILMLLQARGRMTANALAQTMEVSPRTILRDIDQLSAAGVPLWGERGRQGGFQLRAGWSDFENIRFVFPDFLDFFAGVIGMNNKRGLRWPGGWISEEQGGLLVKLRQETLAGAIQSRFGVSGERNREICVYAKCAGSLFEAGGLGHQVQWLLRLRRGGSGEHCERKKRQNSKEVPGKIGTSKFHDERILRGEVHCVLCSSGSGIVAHSRRNAKRKMAR